MNIISVYQGEQFGILCTLRDKNEALIDLTGATIWFTVKEFKTDLDAAAKIQKVSTSASQITIANQTTNKGEFTVLLVKTDTATLPQQEYQYDIKIKFSSGDIRIPIAGVFAVTDDVTISS
jgi:alkyl hydroperoxide reductase subunit AhpF